MGDNHTCGPECVGPFRGLIRIKCIDLANWAAMNDKLSDLPDYLQIRTEGMECMMIYPEQSDTLYGLQDNLAKCLAFAIERFGEHCEDCRTMMKMIKNDMIDHLMTKSYQVQFKYPNAPYIDVIMKDMGSSEPQY